jgi:NTP pyrophosphatase (non-canonical NTP hydrolase)
MAVSFRDARDWRQFHTPKDMAISLMLEAAEVGELFQWKRDDEIRREGAQRDSGLADELSDVLYWVLLMSNEFGIDLPAAFEAKMRKNELKYPIDRAKGSAAKYRDRD